jgi:hypothetical protein
VFFKLIVTSLHRNNNTSLQKKIEVSLLNILCFVNFVSFVHLSVSECFKKKENYRCLICIRIYLETLSGIQTT